MRFRKLTNPNTLKYRLELLIWHYCIPLTGFWFGERYDEQ